MKIEFTGSQERLASLCRAFCLDNHNFSHKSGKVTVNLGTRCSKLEAEKFASQVHQNTRMPFIIKG